MECLEGGQLKNKMEDVFRQGKKFTENEASIIIKTIAEGLAYLHMNDTIHRDLKPGKLSYCEQGKCNLIHYHTKIISS